MREALENGVGLFFELQIRITRQRRWWLDEEVASLRQRHLLEYHALSRQYVVKNLNTGINSTFPYLESALVSIGKVRNFPMLDASLLNRSDRYRVSLLVLLDKDQLPLPLRVRALVSDDWRNTSDTYSWRLD
jgi:hypothetical protein